MVTAPRWIAAALFAAASLASLAASPPATVNYQGVLRNASDKPLTGAYDMTFRFFDAPSGGNEIVVDVHAASGSGAVTATGGLFNTLLGGGTVSDGAGPGTYTNLADVFRDYSAVYIGITVAGETLTPRVKVQSSAYALNASNLNGRDASAFVDTSSASQTKSGPLTISAVAASQIGLTATGTTRGGWFRNAGNVAEAHLATDGGYGVFGYGNNAGGYFVQSGTSTNATIADSNYVITGTGVVGGAYVVNTPGDQALLATNELGVGYGVHAFGRTYGGYLSGYYGLQAYGSYMGGYVSNNAGDAYAQLGLNGGYGVLGYGSTSGGYFKDNTAGAYAYVGHGGYGIESYGNAAPFYNHAGGYFADGGAYTYVGQNNGGTYYKVSGNGAVAFIQNHPDASGETVVYTAPEGDEAAVYTRGRARLSHGEAHVPLGETFKWVVNPDIGLTASVTPHGPCSSLYVASITPTELVVRESAGHSDVAFDWAVWGLRIGYESLPIVQPKMDYSPVPEAESVEAFYAKSPELRRFSPVERFKAMEPAGAAALDRTRGDALVAAINRFDPSVDGLLRAAKSQPPSVTAAPAQAPACAVKLPGDAAAALAPASAGRTPAPTPESPSSAVPPAIANTIPVEVGEEVRGGDVLALDPSSGRTLHLAALDADPRVVGIVAGDASGTWRGTAPVAIAGTIVLCRVDGNLESIAPGDLLVTSSTPGHAMRAGATPAPGTIVGKALEPLDGGQGLIRVLAMAR